MGAGVYALVVCPVSRRRSPRLGYVVTARIKRRGIQTYSITKSTTPVGVFAPVDIRIHLNQVGPLLRVERLRDSRSTARHRARAH